VQTRIDRGADRDAQRDQPSFDLYPTGERVWHVSISHIAEAVVSPAIAATIVRQLGLHKLITSYTVYRGERAIHVVGPLAKASH
jgi:hypothetical protein